MTASIQTCYCTNFTLKTNEKYHSCPIAIWNLHRRLCLEIHSQMPFCVSGSGWGKESIYMSMSFILQLATLIDVPLCISPKKKKSQEEEKKITAKSVTALLPSCSSGHGVCWCAVSGYLLSDGGFWWWVSSHARALPLVHRGKSRHWLTVSCLLIFRFLLFFPHSPLNMRHLKQTLSTFHVW